MGSFGAIMLLLLLGGAFAIACLVLLVSWLTGGKQTNQPPAVVSCPHCGTSQLRTQVQCYRCHAPLLGNSRELRRSDLVATARELKRMLRGKVVSSQQHDELISLIRSEYMRLSSCPEHALPAAMALADSLAPGSETAKPTTPSKPLPEQVPEPEPRAEPATPTEEPLVAEVFDAEVVEPPSPFAPPEPKSTESKPGPPPEQVAALSALEPRRKPAAVHPLDRPAEIERPRQPGPVRRSVADMFSAFMEEKNIRWGELLSGLLIVGSTIGLIVSLRHTLERIPYASALLAMLVTVAIYLSGVYTYRHWKLATTSRGILIIGLLLVPLNFLAALVQSNEQHSLSLYLTAVAVGLGVFGWIVYRSSRILSERHWPWLVAGISVPILSMMLLDRLDKGLLQPWFTSLLMLPTVASLVLVAWRSLLASEATDSSDEPTAASATLERLYLIVGIPLFAVICGLGFYIHAHPGGFVAAVTSLAGTLSLLSSTLLVIGLAMITRSRGSGDAALVLPGPVLALLGTGGVIGSLAVAAADPLLLMVIALVQAGLFALLAWREASSTVADGASIGSAAGNFRQGSFRQVGYAAAASLTLAYLTASGLLLDIAPLPADGTRSWLLELFQSGPMAVALTLWAFTLTGSGLLLRARQLKHVGAACLHSGLAVVVISLLTAGLVSILNPEQAHWTTWLLAGYALTALVCGSVARQKELSAAGAVLLAVALGNALYFGELLSAYPIAERLALAACGYGTLMLLWRGAEVLIARGRSDTTLENQWEHPLLLAMAVASVLALAPVFYLGSLAVLPAAGYLGWISGLWLAVSLLLGSKEHFFVFRAQLTVTAGYLAVAATERFYPELDSLWNLRHLLSQVIALTALSVLWMALEAAGRRLARLEELLGKPGQAERELFHYLALAGVVVIAAALSFHGIGAELDLMEAPTATATASVSYAGGFWLAWVLITAALAGRVALSLQADGAGGDLHRLAPRQQAMLVFLGATALLPIAIALHAEPPLAMATALRWCFSLYAIVAAGAVVLLQSRQRDDDSAGLAFQLSDPLLALGAIPVCGITLLAFGGILSGNQPAGPLAESWLGQQSLFVSYVIPLVLVVAAMVMHGVALRRPRNLALGSLTLQASISLACCLSTYLGERDFDTVFLVELLQANALALPLYGWLWWALHHWLWADDSEPLLDLQVSGAIAASSVAMIWITLGLWLHPIASYPVQLLGAWPGWLALVLTAALALISTRPRSMGREPMLHWTALAAIALAAAMSATWMPDQFTPWIGAHVMQIGLLALALVSTARATLFDTRHRDQLVALATAAVVGALAFAGRGTFSDPLAPWWQVGVIAASIVPLAWLAIARRSQLYAYSTTLLAAAMPVAVLLHNPSWESFWINGYLALIAAGVAAFAWLLVELGYQRQRGESLDTGLPLAVHRVYAWLLAACSALSLPILYVAFHEGFLPTWLPSLTAGCLTLLMLLGMASLWDRQAQFPLQLMHLGGGLWLGWGLVMAELSGSNLLLAGIVGVTVYGTLMAWLAGRPLAAAGRNMALPAWDDRHRAFRNWLLATAMLSAAITLPLCLLGVLNYPERMQVILWGMTPALIALEALLLIDNTRRIWLRGVVLLLAVSSAVLLSWADLHDSELPLSTVWLLRMIRTVIVTAAMSFLLGVVGARRLTAENPWRAVLARGATACMGVAVVLLLPILATEISVFNRTSGLPIDPLHGGAVAISLVGILVTLLVFALSKGLDPLELGESQKQLYIYAAEVVLVLIGGQIYLMVPWLFGGIMVKYWPLIVMGIAFAGAGISELARRSGSRVLADPLYHTSLLLPVLPALGVWILAADVPYSLVMFAAGAMYTVLALTRHSPLSTVAAVVAGNLGLWSLMHSRGFAFLEHPQFWLIPPAAAVLVAAHLQRERIGEGQLAAIRYMAMLVIYLSSMSEIFIHNVSESLWPIMLLATLAVAGALAGMALRIRAFLYTGSSFLAFAMFSMVWHMYRQVGHSAVLWVFMITLGLAILLLFALFEKNRDQMKGWLREMGQWEK